MPAHHVEAVPERVQHLPGLGGVGAASPQPQKVGHLPPMLMQPSAEQVSQRLRLALPTHHAAPASPA